MVAPSYTFVEYKYKLCLSIDVIYQATQLLGCQIGDCLGAIDHSLTRPPPHHPVITRPSPGHPACRHLVMVHGLHSRQSRHAHLDSQTILHASPCQHLLTFVNTHIYIVHIYSYY